MAQVKRESEFADLLVTVVGGSSGIGHGIARAFADAGAEVMVTGTRPTRDDYEQDLGRFAYRQLDVSDEEAVGAVAASQQELDVLVCAAGTVAYKRAEFEIPAFRRTVEVNLVGAMAACTGWHDALVQRSGSIVVIGSISSFIATPGQPGYSASKGGLLTLVKSLAHAWARDGVRVNGVAPGFVETKLTAATWQDPAAHATTLARIPLRRWGTPEDVAHAAMFLASARASYITGQMLRVDGGITLM